MNMNEGQDLVLDAQNNISQLWSINYINALIVNMLINISSIILITVLPLYTMTIGGNNLVAGLLTTLLTTSALIFRPVFGKMIDTKSRKMVLLIGLSLFGLSSLILFVTTNMYLLLILRLFQGIGLSAYSTALGTIVSDIVPFGRISEGLGYFGISATIAMAIGPTLGLYLCEKWGYGETYIATFIFAMLSIVFAVFINYESAMKNVESCDVHKVDEAFDKVVILQKSSFFGFIEKTAIRPCLVLFFTVFAISAVFSFMPLFSKERNIDNIGLFFTVYAISMIITRLVTGKMADNYGFIKTYLPGITITFLLFATLIFANTLPAVLVAAVFYGVGYGMVQPLLNAMVIRLSPPSRRGAANATFYATMDICFGVGSFVWGAVSQLFGFTAVFIGCAFCVILSIALFYLFLYKVLREKQML